MRLHWGREFVPLSVVARAAYSSLQAGIRPWHRKGFIGKVREGHDDWRRRRKLKLELENNGRDSKAGSKDRTKRKRSSFSSSSSDNRSDGRRLLQQAPGMFVPSPEAAKRRAKDDTGGAKEVHSRKPSKGRKAASRQEKAAEGGTAKGKRRALQALWGRVVARLGGGRGGGGKNGDREGEEDARRAGLLKELRRKVEERYGSEFWGRAKAAGHELDDELLMRWAHGKERGGGVHVLQSVIRGFTKYDARNYTKRYCLEAVQRASHNTRS